MAAQEIIPSGIATDATVQALSSLQAEVRALNDTMLYFITAMMDKMPLLDSNDRAQVVIQNTPTVNIAASQTVATVTAVGTISNLAGGNAALLPYQLGVMPAYISDNIKVS